MTEAIFVFLTLSKSHSSSSFYFAPSLCISTLKIKAFELISSHGDELDDAFNEGMQLMDAASSQLLQGREMCQAVFQQHWHQANNNVSIVPSNLSVSYKLRYVPLSMHS